MHPFLNKVFISLKTNVTDPILLNSGVFYNTMNEQFCSHS